MDQLEIIERISRLRARENLSARKLSTLIGKNESYIAGLESRKDFLPSLEVLLEIIKVCGSEPMEFFHYSLDEYATDKKLIDLLKIASPAAKTAALSVLQLK
jgi:transcriptional regulator with XRE-family HTH domain